jgi:uncharacterized protein
MSVETGEAAVRSLVESARTHGYHAIKLKYAGGEASLNWRLVVHLHEFARKLTASCGLDLQATLLTNGVGLQPAFQQFLRESDIRVMISLDGVGNVHDRQRPLLSGRPSFKFVDRTITDLLDAGITPHASITITGRNQGDLGDVVAYALGRGVTFSLNFFRDNDCASTFSDLQFEQEGMIRAFGDATRALEENLPAWSLLGSILDRGQLLTPSERVCGVGEDYVVVDHRGGVAKCHMEIERTIGDVFRDDPIQLIRNDKTTVLNLSASEKEGCRDCTWQNWCAGGCSVATFRATGRFDVKSPNCQIYKAIYPLALRMEGLRLLKYGKGEMLDGHA